MLSETIKTLSKSEKILLINDLWEDISSELEDSSLSAMQKKMLDSRYEALLQDPEEGTSWSKVKNNLKELL